MCSISITYIGTKCAKPVLSLSLNTIDIHFVCPRYSKQQEQAVCISYEDGPWISIVTLKSINSLISLTKRTTKVDGHGGNCGIYKYLDRVE